MRFVYSAAAALVAVFASSDAASNGADANALLESDVSVVARVTDGNAYDVDTQRLLREALDDDESMLPADFEERAPGGAVVEEAAPKLEKALSGVRHAGEVGGGAGARLAETAIANTQRIEEIQRGAVAKVQHVEETQGGAAAQGQHVEEIQGGAVAKGQHVEETHGEVAAKGQHVEEIQATTKLSWTKRQWEKFVNFLNKSKLFRDFMAWIKSHKAKVKPVGEGKTADANNGKKLEDAVEDAGTVGTAGATRAADPDGAANAGVHPFGDKLKPRAMDGAAKAAAGKGVGLQIIKEILVFIDETISFGQNMLYVGQNHLKGDIIATFALGFAVEQMGKDLWNLKSSFLDNFDVDDTSAIKSAWNLFDKWRGGFVKNIDENVVGAFKNVGENVEVNALKLEVKAFVDKLQKLTLDDFTTILGKNE
ncbi:unnamed protein product [Hyaloperonospora brassicae]|uniref:RxLR effector protein n=1 Tax=Hyaloperonospora brassicae TaxID=162125 RepID=A0AAV0T6C8_HYABA|nr:unnamed protein product [Hyaloperonospora brassicae]